MKETVVILGSINYDVVASAERLPAKGETVNGYSVNMYGGGKGANQSIQCAQMGLHTILIGSVGKDMQGISVLEALKSKKVDCQFVQVSETERTGCASIYVDPNGDNTLVFAPGVNHHLSKKLVDQAADAIRNAGVFLTVNEINLDAMQYGLEAAHKAGVVTILNPAPAMTLPDSIFPLVDYITPNETESEVYTGLHREDLALEDWESKTRDWFLNHGVKHICITMGEKGSYYADTERSFTIPAFKIKPVDTTAAGDSFHGGLAYGLIKGYDIETCLKFGNACGGLSAMSAGAQSSIQPLEHVMEFLSRNGVTF